MGKLDCDKGECFYNSSNKCTNIAVSITSDCGLYLDTNNKKKWEPKTLSRPTVKARDHSSSRPRDISIKKAGAIA